jgi:predicted permease
MRFFQRARYWIRKNRHEAELAEEIETHRRMVEEDLARGGMTQREAAETSHRAVGNALLAREESCDVWIWPWVTSAWQDLRYAVRMLLRQPPFAAVVITMLALGIGTSTVVFSVVNGILLRQVAAERPEELARIVFARQDNRQGNGDLSWPNYSDLRERSRSFTGLAGHTLTWVAFGAADTPDVVFGEFVTSNYFDVIGVRLVQGRGFSAEEGRVPGGSPVVVLSHSLWKRKFAASPTALGRTVQLNGNAFTVIGIAPEAFTGTQFPLAADFWVPVAMRTLLTGDNNWIAARGQGLLAVTGRLKPGTTIRQAQADLNQITSNLEAAHPDTNKGIRVRVVSESEGRLGEAYRAVTLFAVFVLALASLVLLITCANVANLLLGRALVRTREMGIRMAIGAGRGRILRQLFIESALLAFLGGLLGIALTYAGTDLVRSLIPPVPPVVQDFNFSPDGRVFLWALVVSVITGFLFGLAPALRAARTDLIAVTKFDAVLSVRRRRLAWGPSDLLVGAQICVSVVVLVCAGLFVRSLRNAQTTDPGFRPEGLVSMMVSPGLLHYSAAQAQEFYQRLERNLALQPGVSAASVAGSLLLTTGARSTGPIVREGQAPPPPNQGMTALYLGVGPGYFDTAGTRLTRGRSFTERDASGAAPVAIVNQEFARRVFGAEASALGGRFRIGPPANPMVEVVGIARNGRYGSLYESPQPVIFLPLAQRGEISELSTAFLLARTGTADLRALAETMRREAQKIDARVPVTTVRMGEEHLSVALTAPRMASALAAAFGLLALALATAGVYSVMSHAVSRRTRELGIRIAVGARPGDVKRLAMRDGMRVVLVAMAAGLLLTFAATRMLQGFLLDVNPSDPATIAGVVLVLAAASLAACYLPARRAARVDPMVALRSE